MTSRLILGIAAFVWGLAPGSRAQLIYENYTFTTLAGPAETAGNYDGSGSAARFFAPFGVAVDNGGNVYVADSGNHTIRKITPAGVVSTFAGLEGSLGRVNGSGSEARFFSPNSVAVDPNGNVYVADTWNHAVRKITPAGEVTTFAGELGTAGFADGTGSDAQFFYPTGVAADSNGNIYVADNSSHTIRKITPAREVTTFAGKAGLNGSVNGTGNAARFSNPFGLGVDTAGNLYVAENSNHTIRKITPARVVTTFAGTAGSAGSSNGTGTNARFNSPFGVAVDGAGNVYVADINHTIRKITSAGVATTLAGATGILGNADGAGTGATFNFPTGVAVDSSGNVHVADYSNNSIRKITAAGDVTTVAGKAGGSGTANGAGGNARFNFPAGVAVDPNNNNLYVVDLANHAVRKISPLGIVTTFAGLPGTFGSVNGTGTAARFNGPTGIATDPDGNVYIADSVNHTIRKITPAGEVTTLAGLAGTTGNADGTGSDARFFNPFSLTADAGGNIYVADTFNHTIRKITPAGVVTTLAGLAANPGATNGVGSAARFNFPEGIAVDSATNLYVADSFNYTIRKINPAGEVTTLAGAEGISGAVDGPGSAARFFDPFGVAVDNQGNVYVTEISNQSLRKITPVGDVTTIAGVTARAGAADGTGPGARFNQPEGLAVDQAGNIFVADSSSHTIRKGFPALSDSPGVDLPFGPVGVVRNLTVTNLTTTAWAWSFIRYPSGSAAQLSSASVPNPSFTPDVSDLYVLRFQGWDNQGRPAIGTVSIYADSAIPTVEITTPTPGQRWSNGVFTATGIAHDNVGISSVRFRVNAGDWTTAHGTTNWTANLTLIPGTNTFSVMATDTSGNESPITMAQVFYVVTTPLIVQIDGKGSIKPNYNNQLLEIGRSYTIVATPAAGSTFSQWTDGEGTVIGNSATLTFLMQANLTLRAKFLESAKPSVVITSPKSGLRWNSETFAVTGTAKDNVQVASVWYQINGAGWNAATTANGFATWEAEVTLLPGLNILRAYAVDSSGNHSATNSTSFTYVLSDRLTLSTTGLGTLTPNYSNALLEIGKAYTITAKPASGSVFSNWTGNFVTTTPALTFTMQSNLTLQANFVINPFLARKGSYKGLAWVSSDPAVPSSGFINLTLSDKGSFSGKLLLAGATHSFSGAFAVNGTATLQILRPGKSTLQLSLALDLASTETLTGTMSDGSFTAQILADRAIYSTANPAPYSGKYTLVLPTTDTVSGDGIGTVTVTSAGVVTFVGSLADGTPVSQSASVSRTGQWPLYLSLYQRRGVLLGWVQFEADGLKSFTGDAQWIKTPHSATFYPGGFDDPVTVTGNQYVPPTGGASVLDLSNGILELSDGNLATAIADAVTLANNKFQVVGTNAVKLTVATASGLVSGSFIHPQSRKTTPLKAVVLQGSNTLQGFFLGTDQSGGVFLGP